MIGIFDSGSGGLTVLKEISPRLPRADIVYFGDIKNTPYGNKSLEELGALTVLGFEKLLQAGATHIVSACNSVSAYIALPLFQSAKVPRENIIEMIGPTVRALKNRKDRRIVVIGTVATIRSGIYEKGFKESGREIISYPMKDLAGAIERGESDETIKKIIDEELSQFDLSGGDLLVLGCTHFPLVRNLFVRSFASREGVPEIFDPAIAVAEEVSADFPSSGNHNLRFIISAESEVFRKRVKELFGNTAYTIEVLD